MRVDSSLIFSRSDMGALKTLMHFLLIFFSSCKLNMFERLSTGIAAIICMHQGAIRRKRVNPQLLLIEVYPMSQLRLSKLCIASAGVGLQVRGGRYDVSQSARF